MEASRVEIAAKLFKDGYNCSQALIGAYCDLLGFDFESAMKISSGMGGGLGRMREVCGAIIGASILAGLKYGSADSTDIESKKNTYAAVQQIAAEFKKTNPSIVCKELLNPKLIVNQDTSEPDIRSEEYYKKRPCVQIIMDAAQAVEDIIFKDIFKDKDRL